MQTADMNRVDTILASAGTGKTTALVKRIVSSIGSGMAPERITATTFTRKAAAELADRLTNHMARTGGPGMVSRASGVRIGTINAVCGQLCRDFALQLGIPPRTTVLDDEEARSAFHSAAAVAIGAAAPSMNALSEAFGFPEARMDWRDQVFRIVELARSHGIGPSGLEASAEKSTLGLLGLMPTLATSSDHIDDRLFVELKSALDGMQSHRLRIGSRPFVDTISAAHAAFARGERPAWPAWAGMAVPGVPRAYEAAFSAVAAAASAHEHHPGLKADLVRFIRETFACAAAALEAYGKLKAQRGAMDFSDQEVLALRALRDPANGESLRERLGLVLVDEMQDSSPIQICIATALAGFAERSVWVGDSKQSIFGFRYTDAALTLEAARGAASVTGGRTEVLSASWRSRPGIRAFVNDCFVPAFGALGLESREVAFSDGGRTAPPAGEPPLAVWRLSGRNRLAHAASIAGGVAAALAAPSTWLVEPRVGELRPLLAGDVAVLCRSRGDVDAVSEALAQAGVQVASARSGLFAAPEAQLARAAIRWVADGNDTLALTELARLVGPRDRPSAWLDALASKDQTSALAELVPFAHDLTVARARVSGMTVSESVDIVFLVGGVLEASGRWGEGRERRPALEALRGLAARFESSCVRASRPATLGGFANWISSDDFPLPRRLDGNAVHVLTYHAAKGLEWPMVVCCQLETPPRTSLHSPCVESEGEVDWLDPLNGRWIRFWPWPYGSRFKDVPLRAAAAASDAGSQASKLAREEALRLLYVGMTRARDHLVLAADPTASEGWLRTLEVDGKRVVAVPLRGQRCLPIAGREHEIRCMDVSGVSAAATSKAEDSWASATRGRRSFNPLRISPGASREDDQPSASRTVLGPRVRVGHGADMNLLGSALHAFLAADAANQGSAHRTRSARRHIAEWQTAGSIDPDDMVLVADRLWAWIAARFPGASTKREVTIYAPLGRRMVVGRLDLMVQGEGWFAIIDHKAFPGAPAQWDVQARRHVAQLDLYAHAVSAATGAICQGTFLHLPLAGAMLELTAAAPGSVRRAARTPSWSNRNRLRGSKPLGQDKRPRATRPLRKA